MSRYCDDYDDYDNNSHYLWESNYKRALRSKRGQRVLKELREALLALPKHELISGAMCTVDPENRADGQGEWFLGELRERDEGVCAMGAYAWHKLVQKGLSPDEAFAKVPTLLDDDGETLWDTALYIRDTFGVAVTLAWDIAYRNDEQFGDMTPAERWGAMLRWVELQLLEPVGAGVFEIEHESEGK